MINRSVYSIRLLIYVSFFSFHQTYLVVRFHIRLCLNSLWKFPCASPSLLNDVSIWTLSTLLFLSSEVLFGDHFYQQSILILQDGVNLSCNSSYCNLWLFSVQFSRSVVSDSSRPHELQHARSPCPSPTSGVHSDSHPSSEWCHPAISSSAVPFSSCPQSFPASESFPMSQLFTWGGQSTGDSALASFLPKKSQGWSPSEWTGWISLQSKGLSRVFSNTTVQKHSSTLILLDGPTLTSIHDHRKNHSLD